MMTAPLGGPGGPGAPDAPMPSAPPAAGWDYEEIDAGRLDSDVQPVAQLEPGPQPPQGATEQPRLALPAPPAADNHDEHSENDPPTPPADHRSSQTATAAPDAANTSESDVDRPEPSAAPTPASATATSATGRSEPEDIDTSLPVEPAHVGGDEPAVAEDDHRPDEAASQEPSLADQLRSDQDRLEHDEPPPQAASHGAAEVDAPAGDDLEAQEGGPV